MKREEYELGSLIEARLDAIHMTPAEREAARTAMHNAFRIVDALAWIADKVRSVGSWASHKPTGAH